MRAKLGAVIIHGSRRALQGLGQQLSDCHLQSANPPRMCTHLTAVDVTCKSETGHHRVESGDWVLKGYFHNQPAFSEFKAKPKSSESLACPSLVCDNLLHITARKQAMDTGLGTEGSDVGSPGREYMSFEQSFEMWMEGWGVFRLDVL